MSDLSIRIKHMDELGIDASGDLSDDFYLSHGAPAGGRSRPLSQLQPLDGRHRQGKRRTVFAGWWCRRCSTWIGWRRN